LHCLQQVQQTPAKGVVLKDHRTTTVARRLRIRQMLRSTFHGRFRLADVPIEAGREDPELLLSFLFDGCATLDSAA